MTPAFAPDFHKISIEEYRQNLAETELLPSRRILKEDLDQRFDALGRQGIVTVGDLMDALKSKQKIADLAQSTGVPDSYLTILRREVNSLIPKPKKLGDFPGVDSATLAQLDRQGIGNTKQMFELCRTADQRKAIAAQGIDSGQLLEMLKLADLSRVYGVGPVFARLLYDAGAETVDHIARADPEALFTLLGEEYKKRGYEKVDFTLRDIEFCVRMAQKLPRGIAY